MALSKGETLDLNTLEVVPVTAAEKKPETTEAKKEEEKVDDPDEEEEEESEEESAEKKKEAEQEEEEEEEKSEEEADKKKETEAKEKEKKSEEDKSDKDKKPEKKVESKKEDLKPEQLNSAISSRYSEKYNIKSQEELDEVLETVNAVADRNKELEAALKDKKPEFASESQQKAFDFIKNLDPSKFGEGLQTYGRLMTIDPDKDDARVLMEEAFILDHPEFTREEAQRKFNRDYNKQYSEPSKDEFEDEDELKEEADDRKLKLKSAEAKARRTIKEKQKEFKASSNKDEKAKPVISEDVEIAIKKNGKIYTESLNKVTELVFSPTEDEEDDFSCKFSQDELKNIRAVCDTFVKNPSVYTDKGELKEQDLDPEKLFKRVAYYLYGDKIVEKMSTHLEDVFSVKRAEEIGKNKPERKPKLPSASKPVLSEEEQIEALIKLREKNAGKRRPVAA